MYLHRIFLVALALACPAAAAEVVRWTGYAYDLESGEPIYTERHLEEIEGGESVRGRVSYVGADGLPIAEKTLDFRAPLLPNFNLEDTRIGYREGIEREGQTVVVYKQEPGSDALQTSRVNVEGEVVADAGFDAFIRQHFEEIRAGSRLVFDFVVPSQLKAIRFRVEKVGESRRDGLQLLQVELKPDGFLLRNLVPSIELDYNLDSGQLYEYRGISNVRKPNGKGYQARIVFPPDERRVGSAGASTPSEDCQVLEC
jgi:hypothetical protein